VTTQDELMGLVKVITVLVSSDKRFIIRISGIDVMVIGDAVNPIVERTIRPMNVRCGSLPIRHAIPCPGMGMKITLDPRTRVQAFVGII